MRCWLREFIDLAQREPVRVTRRDRLVGVARPVPAMFRRKQRHTLLRMRLTDRQHTTLTAAVRRHFGAQARSWLFGSRVDDGARGGDFDVMVQADAADAALLYGAKLALLADLHATPEFDGERIDVVLWSPRLDPVLRPVQRAALAQGLELVS